MTVLVVATVAINKDQPLALAKYLDVTGPLLEEAGAKIVKRFLTSEVVIGNATADRSIVMVEYPNRDAVDKVFGSPEYQGIIPLRDVAFSEYSISIVDDALAVGKTEAATQPDQDLG